ncbi:MAG: MarR family transcriptional regulator [Planctomycetota bacterium]|nr:MAG: MarR family transcriptional regulator [Planctomycetota bacterium]
MPSRLAQEVGKKQPFNIPEQEAFLNLLRTTSTLEAEFKRLFRKHGLSLTTYNLLRIARGHRPDGVRCSTIRDQLIVRVPDVTRLVDRLIDRGLVRREVDPDDARAVRIHITRKGLRLLDKLDEPVVELHRAQLSHMSAEQLNTLSELLQVARNST